MGQGSAYRAHVGSASYMNAMFYFASCGATVRPSDRRTSPHLSEAHGAWLFRSPVNTRLKSKDGTTVFRPGVRLAESHVSLLANVVRFHWHWQACHFL